LATTFFATLFLPIAAAVGVGVALSLLLQLNAEAIDLSIVEIVPHADGTLTERAAPGRLQDGQVVLLDIYGSLYYAGARTLEARLPQLDDARDAIVVLRLRGRTALGATAFVVLAAYADALEANGGGLFVSGVDPALVEQLRYAGGVDDGRRVRVFAATEVIGASSRAAYETAKAVLARTGGAEPDARVGRSSRPTLSA
jgi:SulP family sulfate permease